MDPLARLLVIAGAVLLAVGLWLHLGPSVPWLGKLPGDLRIERPGFTLYAPITTSLVLSVALTVLLWLLTRGR